MRPSPPSRGGGVLLGIIGNPVARSLSPRMQEAALRALGIAGSYRAFEVGPRQVGGLLRALGPLGYRGLNVTIPYKEAVLRHLDRVDPRAAAMGAVNTVVVRRGGLVGYNTDGAGFLRALREGSGAGVRGKRLLVVGAGGAARAIAFASLGGGCRALVVANRTPGKARSLAALARRRFPGAAVAAIATSAPGFPAAVAGSDVVVNTTPLGGRPGDPLPVPAAALRPGQVVMDIVYRPLCTPLLAAAGRAGARGVDGLGMLLHQGALAFRLWTGRPAPVEAMRRALRAGARAGGASRP